MQLILLRHGQTDWNLAFKMQGWRDSKLTHKARKQLAKLNPANINCDVIYSSDLGRAMASARIVANKSKAHIILDKRLRERSFGILEGHTKLSDTMPKHYWQAYQQRYIKKMQGVPKVETELHFESRIRDFIAYLQQKHAGQTVLLVSHGEWLRTVLNITNDIEPWHQGEGIFANGMPIELRDIG